MTVFTGNTVASGDVILASDHNTLVTQIAGVVNGNIDNSNIVSGAAIAGSKLADASVDVGLKASVFDGWVAVSDSWSYASATTITVPTDATTKYSVGDKIKIVQSATTKYYYVTAVAATVLTVNGGTDYTVANSAISGIYYSKVQTPLDFPQWFNYTPTYTNLTVGNGTHASEFKMAGKIVTYKVKFTFGSTSSMGSSPNFSLPVTAAYSGLNGSCTCWFDDTGTANFQGVGSLISTTAADFRVTNSASTYATQNTLSSTVPHTWANTDLIWIYGWYKAA